MYAEEPEIEPHIPGIEPHKLGIEPHELVRRRGNELDVLTELMKASGFDVVAHSYDTNSLEVNTGCGTVTVTIDNEKTTKHNAYGLYEYCTSTIYISTEKPRTVAELITILRHEINHHVLNYLNVTNSGHGTDDYYIYVCQLEYMKELVAKAKKAGLKNPYSLKFRVNERFMWLVYSIRMLRSRIQHVIKGMLRKR